MIRPNVPASPERKMKVDTQIDVSDGIAHMVTTVSEGENFSMTVKTRIAVSSAETLQDLLDRPLHIVKHRIDELQLPPMKVVRVASDDDEA